MSISLKDAKKIVWSVSDQYDRCMETPNFFEFNNDKDFYLKSAYVSKVTGGLEESRVFYRDFYHDIRMREYELSENEEKVVRDYTYCYYPDLKVVTKSDGCTFFDTERGFIFDSDGDWSRKGVFGGRRTCNDISAEEALEIINWEDYSFLFFGEYMKDEDVEYYEKMGMPYRLKQAKRG